MLQVQTEPNQIKIRICEVTGALGQLFPLDTEIDETYQANTLYISCD